MPDNALDDRQLSGDIQPILADLIPTTPETNLPSSVPTAAVFPVIKAGTVTCLPGEAAIVEQAYEILGKITSSEVFKQAVLRAEFTETNGLSTEQIYELALQRSPISVDFTMFDGSWKQNHLWHTEGYEDPHYPTVCFANRHFIHTKEQCGSLILHETMHIVGFQHKHDKSSSVPYTMNRIFDEVARALHLGPS